MVTDADQFGKCCNGRIHLLREANGTVRHRLYVLLQKTVNPARTKLRAAQIVFRYKLICLHRQVWNHYNTLSCLKAACRIINDTADSFVNQCHRQLSAQYFSRTRALVISLVCIADR